MVMIIENTNILVCLNCNLTPKKQYILQQKSSIFLLRLYNIKCIYTYTSTTYNTYYLTIALKHISVRKLRIAFLD